MLPDNNTMYFHNLIYRFNNLPFKPPIYRLGPWFTVPGSIIYRFQANFQIAFTVDILENTIVDHTMPGQLLAMGIGVIDAQRS